MYEPQLSTYNVYAALFSIIAKNDDYLPWLYSNFISIGINTCDDTIYFTDHFSFFEYGRGYTSCPWLEVEKPAHKLIYSFYKSNIKDALLSYLNQDKYVWLYLDQYYIPQSENHLKKHRDHSVLVYGYDDEQKLFHLADNLDGGKFAKVTITYEQLVNAWENDICEHFRRFFIVLNRKDASYDFDICKVKKQIENYLSSRCIDEGFFWNQIAVDGPHAYVQHKDYWIFGQDVYRYVQQQINKIKTSKIDTDLDIRVFHLLWEHKICMLERMKFIVNNEDLCNEYEVVSHVSLVIRNLVIKYNISKNNRLLDDINNKLEEVVQLEKNVLVKLIAIL
ncbi:hypothetical protein [Paenibacillus sp. OK003]|uniref:hypothetical protein n=1 Tax=Paenibacillus sp. OK003 TaxID=1884380 RepID=UPI0011143C32|nr:hypothetical protein [Paenibacillus sp. OK003]